MKYDSGMKQFHKDILAALQYMLKDDKEIAEKFSPKDGSPAPMRDYLKQKYGKSRASHIGNGMRYCCNFSKGLELTFDTILNNPGDKNLTLSWSQTAKFIRDNWDEVFKKPETEELPPQLSYIDKLREKYPKVSETDDWFDTVYCPSELFDGDGVNDPGDEKCDYTTKDFEACQKCWRERCPANIEFLTDPYFEKEYFENYPDEEASEAVPEEEKSESDDPSENQIIPQNAGEISEAFNYAVLSAEIGDYLKRKEQQLKNEYMNFICKWGEIFADAQETLAKHGFGENNGIFHKWFDSLNLPISRRTMYRMISVYKFRSCQIGTNEEVQKIFDSFPKTSQYEIAEGKAPAELVEQVRNGDITTHKDYIALKKQLEYTKAACDHANKRRDENYNQYQDEHRKNVELEKRVKELESRPIDVAVQQDETSLAEIDRLKNELAKAQQEILNASFGSSTADSELLTDLYETLHGSALSAIRSCADFAEKNGGKFTSRFRSLAEVINDYLNEMEEF